MNSRWFKLDTPHYGRTAAILLLLLAVGAVMLPGSVVSASNLRDQDLGGGVNYQMQVTPETRAILEGGVTKGEHRAAIERLRTCMGIDPSDDRFLGPVDDLSGIRSVYYISAESAKEISNMVELHDSCYEETLLAVDVEYQLSTEAGVDQFYLDLRRCASGLDDTDAPALLSPVAAEVLSPEARTRLDPCLP